MNEKILKALLRLFALVSEANKSAEIRNKREIVSDHLHHQLDNELAEKYLEYYDQRVDYYHPESLSPEHDVIHGKTLDERLDIFCDQLNEELEREQKILIIINLLDFISADKQISPFEIVFVDKTAKRLLIDEAEYYDIKQYSLSAIDKIKNKANLLFIDAYDDDSYPVQKHIRIDNLDGRIIVLYVKSSNTFVVRYFGNDQLTLQGQHLKKGRTYIWSLGGVIHNPKVGSIYYTWVSGKFIQETTKVRTVFNAFDIEYSYGSGPNGIKPFTLTEESGRMIGIIGSSGSGKSTLLKVLNGNIKPHKGRIEINGFDLHADKDKLEGVIGYVPQDDTLIKELTVYQNLYYNAKLCFGNYTENQIHEVVEQSLENFDLFEARDLRVGDALNTYLSGGQRKRLNIALELMREPSVLFVDEPTSGLSSMDSERVMGLLKRQTFKGKLIFATIHQPSSEKFKLLDKLLVIDQGGYVVYYGNPVDAVTYFKRKNRFVDAEFSECPTCGNIDTDQILRNIEARVVDVNGRLTLKRKKSPRDWYEDYMETIEPQIQKIKRPYQHKVPESDFKIPGHLKQIGIFFKRDLFAKLANRQYVLLTLLEAPLLALILAIISRNSPVTANIAGYVFGENPNIPGFLIMSVIVALFLGMVISAEEIFKDKKLLEREKFLNFSRSSYLNAKILILFIISALQMLMYVVISNYILGIRGLTAEYFFILFTSACWANLIGLNISSGFKSVVAIYILVPLILVPQLLFSGVIIDFHKMNKAVQAEKYVPVIGDLITSRWSYENLAVTQFKKNDFEKRFYETEKVISNTFFDKVYRLSVLRSTLDDIEGDPDDTINEDKMELMTNELTQLSGNYHVNQVNLDEIMQTDETGKFKRRVSDYLDTLEMVIDKHYQEALDKKNEKFNQMVDKLGDKKQFAKYKNKFYNKQLADQVMNVDERDDYYIHDNEMIPLTDPIYRLPDSRWGRAHFFAPAKITGNIKIDTFWFNNLRTWLVIIFWYVLLYYDVLNKIITYFERLRLQEIGRKRFSRLIGFQI